MFFLPLCYDSENSEERIRAPSHSTLPLQLPESHAALCESLCGTCFSICEGKRIIIPVCSGQSWLQWCCVTKPLQHSAAKTAFFTRGHRLAGVVLRASIILFVPETLQHTRIHTVASCTQVTHAWSNPSHQALRASAHSMFVQAFAQN